MNNKTVFKKLLYTSSINIYSLVLAWVLVLVGSTQRAVSQEASALLDALVEEKVLTMEQADRVRDRLAEEWRQKGASKLDSGGLLDRITLQGDLRLRYEFTELENAYDAYDGDRYPANVSGDPNIRKGERIYNPDGVAGRDDRSRLRYRFRFGALITLPEKLEFGFRFATGQSAEDVVSTMQTMGDANRKDGIYLDQAYLRWQPAPWVTLVGGKFDFTVSKPLPVFWTTDMYFDQDVTFEGFAQSFNYPWKDFTFFANLGQFVFGDVNEADEDEIYNKYGRLYTWYDLDPAVDSDGDGDKRNDRDKKVGNQYAYDPKTGKKTPRYRQVSNNDGWLFAGQLGFRHKVTPALDYGAAAGFWYWANANDLAAGQKTPSGGLTYVSPGSGNNVGEEFEILDFIADATYRPTAGWFKDVPFRWYGHVVWNLAPGPNLGVLAAGNDLTTDAVYNNDDPLEGPDRWRDRSDNFAWRTGIRVGDSRKRGGFQIDAFYEQVGSDAVPDSFNDSEIANGFTNHKGFGVRTSYALRDWWTINLNYFNSSILDPDINQDLNRGNTAEARNLQIETNLRF